jgi:hypothetical protein
MKNFLGWANRAGVAAVPLSQATRSAATQSASRLRGASPLRWSWRLVRVAGIDIYAHGTLLLLIPFVAMSDLMAGQTLAAMVLGTLLILAVFTTVALHEFGHAGPVSTVKEAAGRKTSEEGARAGGGARR